jgi:hypothetical protein
MRTFTRGNQGGSELEGIGCSKIVEIEEADRSSSDVLQRHDMRESGDQALGSLPRIIEGAPRHCLLPQSTRESGPHLDLRKRSNNRRRI